MADLQGKIAIVTGGSQGLGEGIARHFAEQGAAGLVICSRSLDKGERVAEELSGTGTPTEFVRADLRREDDCRAVVEAADRTFGRVDALVNAAGLSSRGTLDDTTVDLWDELFAINTRAPFILTQESVRIMKREKIAGAVVNVISMSGHGGQAFLMAYSASKAALAALTRNNAHALRRDRIRVNGIMLGWMDTPGEHAIQTGTHGRTADWLAEAEAEQPFGRLIKPLDVARLSAFLVSEQSGVMTGALIDYNQSVLVCED